MARFALVADEIVDPERNRSAADPPPRCLLIDGERIVDCLRDDREVGSDWERIERSGCVVAPGFIDVHVHGSFATSDQAALAGAIARDASRMLGSGTTAFLATSLAWPSERQSDFAAAVAAACAHPLPGGATCLGLHFEGPWISPERAGALDPNAIRPFDPSADAGLLERCGERLRMVTLAPEVPGADALLDRLAALGVVAALGHSRATPEDIERAVDRGLRHVTHLFNAMGPLHHREPGVAGTVLADDRLSCDLICDGHHVHPALLRVAERALGERLVLITDRLDWPGLRAEQRDVPHDAVGPAPLRLPDGTIAGSQLGMDDAVRGLLASGASRSAAIAAATLRPARLLGIENERGTLRKRARADLVVLSEECQAVETWIAGRPVAAASAPAPLSESAP